MLQEFAKVMADEGLLHVIMAGSEGTLVTFLHDSSAASRLQVLDFPPDISGDEAATYLKCMCPQISMDDVTSVVTLVGGRFIHLRLAADRLQAGDTIADIQKRLFGRVAEELDGLQVAREPPSRLSSVLSNITWSVAKALLDAPEHTLPWAHVAAVLQPLENSSAKDQLVSSNIFLISKVTQTVRFQNRVVHNYFKSKSNIK